MPWDARGEFRPLPLHVLMRPEIPDLLRSFEAEVGPFHRDPGFRRREIEQPDRVRAAGERANPDLLIP